MDTALPNNFCLTLRLTWDTLTATYGDQKNILGGMDELEKFLRTEAGNFRNCETALICSPDAKFESIKKIVELLDDPEINMERYTMFTDSSGINDL